MIKARNIRISADDTEKLSDLLGSLDPGESCQVIYLGFPDDEYLLKFENEVIVEE